MYSERKKRNPIWEIDIEGLSKIVKSSNSLSEIIKHYDLPPSSGNYTILKNRLWQDQIDFSHIKLGLNSNKGRRGHRFTQISLNQILVEHSTYGRGALKKRLIKEGLLLNQCYDCGISPEWNGKPLSLQLDHINGVSDDNRIENLRILCPNCHAQTETFGSKRRKGTGKQRSQVSDLNPDRRKLPKPSQRKVERPSKDELNKLLWSVSIRQIAKQFGVAETTIVKWAISYQLERPSSDYWYELQEETKRPPKEELEKLLWEMNGKDICKLLKTTKKTLAKWVKEYDLTRPPNGHWKKKENFLK